MDITQITCLVIFIVTYIGIIFTRLPGVNVDRPSAAFSGAIALVLFGVITPREALHSIDFNTILLLLGMMIIIATLQLGGFFTMVARQTTAWSKTRFRLLVIIVFVTGLSSAFLVNDAVVLMFTPVIIQICLSSKLNPVPYLIAEILSSNAGSVMTITGNPQNMLIGINSNISYMTFFLRMFPSAIISMFLIIAVIRMLYRKEFSDGNALVFPEQKQFKPKDMFRSVMVFLLVTVGFFLSRQIGMAIPLIALAGSALILLLGEAKPSDIIQKVDWVLLLFFASLFVIVGAVEKTGLLKPLLKADLFGTDLKGIGVLNVVSLFLSQIVSNVPFTVLMTPVLKSASSPLLWLSLASASTLAGNATIIGAMANIIVIGSANKGGVKIGTMEFFKSGILVTLITMPISMLLLYLQYYIGWI